MVMDSLELTMEVPLLTTVDSSQLPNSMPLQLLLQLPSTIMCNQSSTSNPTSNMLKSKPTFNLLLLNKAVKRAQVMLMDTPNHSS